MASAREIVIRLLLTARDAASGALDRVRAGAAGIGDAVGNALGPLRSFAGLLTAIAGVGAGAELKERAEAYTRLANQIRVATETEEEYQAALQEIAGIAERSNASLETTAALYARVTIAAKSLGISQRQAGELTELISKGMQLGGASAQEYASATLQLTQAFNSGVLRGEEFNAVMEAAPELMKRIAEGLGVAIGELRGFAEQGQLTASAVSQALLSQADSINKAYSEVTVTIEQAATKLYSRSVLFVGALDQQVGASQRAVQALKLLGENLDVVAGVMGAAFGAAAAKAVQSTYGFVAASIAARNAARDQAVAAAQQQAAALATAQANVAAAQAAVNRTLAEQRLAATIVALLQAELGYGVTEAEVAAARLRSAAAAQAATVATERYAAAQAALSAAQAAGAATGVGLFARALAFLTGPGGLLLTAVAGFGLLYAATRKQSAANDELTQSTEQYTESLTKLSAAQIEARLLDINKAIADQEEVMKRARYEARALDETYTETGETLYANRVGTEEYIRAQAALADETAKLADLEAKREAALARLASQQQDAADGALRMDTIYRQITLAMDKQAATLKDLGEQLNTVSDAQREEVEALLEKAELSGDLEAAERLRIRLAEQAAETARESAKITGYELIAAQEKLDKLNLLAKAREELTVEERKSIDEAERLVAAKKAEAAASAAVADRLQEEAKNIDLLVAAERKQVEQAGKIAQLYGQLKAASATYYDALIEQADAEGRSSDARELTLTKLREQARLQDLINQQKQLEAERQRAVLAVLQQESARRLANNETLDAEFKLKLKQQELAVKIAEAEAGTSAAQAKTAAATAALTEKTQLLIAAGYSELEAKRLALLASGQFTAALKIEEEQRKKTAQATDQQKEASEDQAASAERAAEASKAQADALADAEREARRTAPVMAYLAESFGELNEKGRAALDALQSDAMVRGAGNAESMTRAVTRLTVELDRAATGEIAFARAVQTLEETAAGLGEEADLARQTLVQMALAGTRGIDGITQAGEDAVRTLEDIKRASLEAEDALSGMAADFRKQILQIQGDQKALLELEYQDNIKRLEELNARAGELGQEEFLSAKARAEELHRLKLEQIKEEEAAKKTAGGREENGTTTRGGTAPAAPTAPTGGGGKTSGGLNITLNLNANNARLLDKGFVEDLTRQLKPELDRLGRLSA